MSLRSRSHRHEICLTPLRRRGSWRAGVEAIVSAASYLAGEILAVLCVRRETMAQFLGSALCRHLRWMIAQTKRRPGTLCTPFWLLRGLSNLRVLRTNRTPPFHRLSSLSARGHGQEGDPVARDIDVGLIQRAGSMHRIVSLRENGLFGWSWSRPGFSLRRVGQGLTQWTPLVQNNELHLSRKVKYYDFFFFNLKKVRRSYLFSPEGWGGTTFVPGSHRWASCRSSVDALPFYSDILILS